MNGEASNLSEYMRSMDKRFIIPVYQRCYDWRRANCEQFYCDLVKLVKQKRNSHFFGSFVSVYSGKGSDFLIIDGQQRLTTVSLLALAMYKLLKEGKISSKKDSQKLLTMIYEYYLVNRFGEGDDYYRLVPVKKDRDAYRKLFEEDEDYVLDSNMTINYKYFYDEIQKQEISVDELFDSIPKLSVINIQVNTDENPQLIFESLNSTGLELTEGDKIRNYILMGLDPQKQESYYSKYWGKIEDYSESKLDLFLRDYLSVKTQSVHSFKNIYQEFKRFVESGEIETESLLIDLLKYARLYNILLKGDKTNKELNACIIRLNRMETTVSRPFFLEILRLRNEKVLSESNVVEIFHYVESYLFRRLICDVPTSALNKIFLTLHWDIIRFDNTSDHYLDKFKYALLSKKGVARFPDDKEFTHSFSEKQIYRMNQKNKTYIFERFENYDTIEDKDVYRHIDDHHFSIEHIMPQILSPVWQKELGSSFVRIHDTWLHRIANLTLTAYNSKYSNNCFEEKRDMKNGLKNSGIRMNSWIAAQSHWGESELKERNVRLMKLACSIWTYPITKYVPSEKIFESYTLDDDVDLTGRKLIRYSFMTMEQPSSSWINMFEGVVRVLHSLDRSILIGLAFGTKENDELSRYVSNKKKLLRQALEIDEHIYVERNTSTRVKIMILRNLFELYKEAEPSDLVFYLQDSEEGSEDE